MVGGRLAGAWCVRLLAQRRGALFARTAALLLAACGGCTPAAPATPSTSPSSAPVDPAPSASSVASAPSSASPAPAAVASGDAGDTGDGGLALDIIYVPTPQKVVDKMLEVAALHTERRRVRPRLRRRAHRRHRSAEDGRHGVGFDLDPDRVTEATKRAARGRRVAVSIRREDVFTWTSRRRRS